MKTNKHIFLDLDSTLIHSNMEISELEKLKLYSNCANYKLRERIYKFELIDVTSTEGTGNYMEIWGIFRPHLEEFLEFAFEYFEGVHVWSAGQYKYVHSLVELIFLSNRPGKILTYEDCVFKKNGTTYKELHKCIDHKITLKNTFALDDRTDTFSKNENNGILIPKYEPEAECSEILKDEQSLLKLMKWLDREEVRNCEDVRTLDKSKIFI